MTITETTLSGTTGIKHIKSSDLNRTYSKDKYRVSMFHDIGVYPSPFWVSVVTFDPYIEVLYFQEFMSYKKARMRYRQWVNKVNEMSHQKDIK